MTQIKELISSLSIKQRIAIVVAVMVAGLSLAGLLRWQQEADFRALYSSLSQEDAATILQKLKETGVPYRLSDGGTTVRVPSEKVAELRLEMAGAGLPHSGRIGFELFDRTTFGTTDFAEQVNFRRAMEGELERSVMSLAEVEMARVHVTFPKNSVYLDSKEEAKASVLVRIRPAMQLTPANVLAISHLVSSAVEGLRPEAVSVLDMRGNLLSRPRRGTGKAASDLSDSVLDFQRNIEAGLLRKINDTLEPLLGPERFRAGVSVDCDFSSGEQSEETFQPEKSVMTSSTRTEDIQNASTSGGIPGTASSLPRPTGKPSGGGNETIRRSENISYQTSKVVRHVNLPQGVVRKVSASLLLDHTVSFEKQNGKLKRILTPPSIEKIKSIRDVVAGAIGFDERRGDQLIVESLPFESTQSIEPGPEAADPTTRPPGAANGQPNLLQQKPYLWGGVAAVVMILALAAGWFVRKRRKRSTRPASSAPLPPGTVAQALAGPAHNMDLPDAQNAKQLNSQEKPAGYLTEPSNELQELEELTKKIRQGATTNPEPYVNVVRNWLTEEAR